MLRFEYLFHVIKRDKIKIDIPGQAAIEIGAGGRMFYFFHFFLCLYVCMLC